MDYYSWLKAAHLVAVSVFTGGLILNGFLLLCLQPGSPQSDRVISYARWWNGPITGIALILVWVLGLTLAYTQGMMAQHWLSAKMVLVLILSALHGMQSGAFRRMQQSGKPVSALLRNSAVITIVFIAIIAILVVVKPF